MTICEHFVFAPFQKQTLRVTLRVASAYPSRLQDFQQTWKLEISRVSGNAADTTGNMAKFLVRFVRVM